jgi:hypothetical protein
MPIEFPRPLLVFQAAAFAAAALVHSGIPIGGLEDPGAAGAELVIAIVLAGAAIIIWGIPAWTRSVALGAQGFALAGSLIGLSLVVFVGPATAFDLFFHVGAVLVLIIGLLAARAVPRRG